MCGGFTCSKNALIALNFVYVVVAFLLIGVAAYGETASIVSSVPVVGGIVACGVILLLVAGLGLVGAAKHHQVLLFFYMLVLFLLFLIQFSVACACLAVRPDQQETLLTEAWHLSSQDVRADAQNNFHCCGFHNVSAADHPACPAACCAAGTPPDRCCLDGGGGACSCQPCFQYLRAAVSSGLRVSGGIGLFFSFTEIIGFVLAYRYRNQMDPSRGQMLN